MTYRTIVIGDIHGCLPELERLVAELDVRPEDHVVSAGDLVDRGPYSVEVVDWFRERPNSTVVMGNHERKHVRGGLAMSQEIVKLQFGARYEEFRQWAATLPYYLDLPEALVVHGGFEDGVPLDEQREDVLSSTLGGAKFLDRLYGGKDWTEAYSGEKPILFGHRVVGHEPERFGDRAWGLDTGACHGGYLSAMVLPEFRVHRVQAQRDYWREQRKVWQVRVLETRPWASYRWKKLERELGPLRDSKSPRVRAWVLELEAWLAQVDGLLPALIERVGARERELLDEVGEDAFKKAAAHEPHSALLFAAHRGSLTLESIKSQLPDPETILAAARSYGIETPNRPQAGEG